MVAKRTILIVCLVTSTSLLAVALGAAASGAAPAATPSPAPEAPPLVHGDTVDGLPGFGPKVDVGPVVYVPILRDRDDGSGSVLAYLGISLKRLGATQDEVAGLGLPILTADDVAHGEPWMHRQSALPQSVAAARVDRLYQSKQADAGVSTQAYPTRPISYSTSLPVTIYVDSAEQGVSGWQSHVTEAFNSAVSTIATQTGANIYQYVLMTVGAQATDIATYCDMMKTSDYEKGFSPYQGWIVSMFSPGDVSNNLGSQSSWGVELQGTVSSQWGGEDNAHHWFNWCTGAWGSTLHLVDTYAKDTPLNSMTYMDFETTHELAHTFAMVHPDANCYWSGTILHKSTEAFTSASDTPSGCGTELFGVYYFEFSATTNTKMENERIRVTTCYNSGC